MVPNPRYLALNTALMSLRGEDYELHIKGIDELRVRHDSVMVEACNASFQVHLQVDARRVRQPVQRRPAARRPGARLRHELAAAVRQAAVGRDAHRAVRAGGRHPPARPRTCASAARASPSAHDWVTTSIIELYREDIARFRPVLAPDDDEDPFARAGRRPRPDAAGAAPAQRHRLALEPRLLRHHRRQAAPAHREPRAARPGPSVVDEVANAALWLGLMRAVGARHPEVNRMLPFERGPRRTSSPPPARASAAQLTWLDGAEHTAGALALDVLLPLAAEGLAAVGVDRRRPRRATSA